MTVLWALPAMRRLECSLIDSGRLMRNAGVDAARCCDYACGLFVFAKGQGQRVDR
jgi:hypothetical protein